MRIDELRCSFCGAGNGEMRGKRGLKMVFVRQICAALNFAEIANIFFLAIRAKHGAKAQS
jgi:hypothetical protein